MTQYFVDNFQAADLSDFEQLSNLSHHTITAGTFDAKQCLIVTRDFNGSVSLAYTPAGSPDDYEICALIRISETGNNERFGVGGNMTDATSIDGYVCGPRNSVLGLSRIDNSSRTLLGNYSAVAHDATAGWVWYRLRKEGSALKGRYWAELETEPATWQIDTTDPSTVLATGKVGLLSFASSSVDYVAALGIGTNGDTAPTAAVASGLTIDSTDATMQRNTNFQVVCSTPSTTPTTGNTTLTNGNDTLTPSSVTGSDPYTLTFPVGDLTKQVDGTGYDWTLEITP